MPLPIKDIIYLNAMLESLIEDGKIKATIEGVTVEVGEGAFENISTSAKQDEIIVLLTAMLETIDTAKGKLAITGTLAAMSVLTTNASGAKFTQTGIAVNLGADQGEFNTNDNLNIYLNGVLQDKGVDAIFVTANSFYLNIEVNSGDTLIILKEA